MQSLVSPKFLSDAWEVLLLFVVPMGAGMPAGILLAKAKGISWLTTASLYFMSDVVLAVTFEPLMLIFLHWAKKTNGLARFREALSKSTHQITAHYGLNPSAWALIMITFGTEPMTGRSVAKAAGHGFFSGWALVLTGDMIFFAVIMASTLWLNSILGDGTWAAIIIMAALLGGPALIRKLRQMYNSSKKS